MVDHVLFGLVLFMCGLLVFVTICALGGEIGPGLAGAAIVVCLIWETEMDRRKRD